MPARISPSELSTLLILLCVVVVPIAAIAFARSGKALDELGKGTFSIDREAPPTPGDVRTPVVETEAEREEDVRQMVEAAAYRRQTRGEDELDVQLEIDRILGRTPDSTDGETGQPDEPSPGEREAAPAGDPQIRAEIRQLVVANNERRERRGEEPLNIEEEVNRRLREWT